MIKRLRRKFILIAMLSLFCVLAVIIITINALSYRNVVNEADKTLDFIAYNGGMFPVLGAPTKPVAPGETIPYQEITYDSRFFSVTFTAKGELLAVFTDDAKLGTDTAEELSRYVLGFEEDRAFLGNYRYLINRGESFSMVIFLDCTAALSAAKTFLFLSLLISAIGMVAVFILILVTSKIIIKPISENAEKQKRFITDAGHELKTPLTIIDADAELIEMENIGEITANAIEAYFRDESNLLELASLTEVGVAPTWSDEKTEGVFSGQSVVLTGTLASFKRSEAQKLIEARGGVCQSSVTAKTTLVLAGEEAGSKLAKAQKLGIKIITEEEFKQMLED